MAVAALACANRGQRAGPPIPPCAPFERPPTLDAEAIAALAGDYSPSRSSLRAASEEGKSLAAP